MSPRGGSGGRVRRRAIVEEPENHERWLISYADFITLLFALFTVLYVLAQTDAKELDEVIRGMNAAFEGGMPSVVTEVFVPEAAPDLPDLPPNPLSLEAAPPTIQSIKQNLVGSLSDDVVQIGLVDQSLEIVLPERLLFGPGSAELHPSAFAPLTRIARALAQTPARVEIIGHADGAPVGTGSRWADNWELSSARALATARYLQRHGVSEGALSATAKVTKEVSAETRAVTIRVRVDAPGPAAEVGERLGGR